MNSHSRQPRDRHQTSQPKTSWEGVSGWYQQYMGSDGGALQRTVIFPGAIALLEPRPQQTYLDLACGQGAFLRHLINKMPAANYHGIDASPSLIQSAKRILPASVMLRIGDARTLDQIYVPQSIDGISCLLAVQNIDPLDGLFRGVAHCLKMNGSFVMVMNHPCFRQPRQSGWGWDEQRKLQYRRVDRYASTYEMPILAHPGSAPNQKTYSYHRPLQTYVQTLVGAGFVIDALQEWASPKTSDSGPKAKAENIARAEIPLFLALRARKIDHR